MVKCNFKDCDEILNYLPFKCRYCGNIYCKKHRLPENHDCSFEMDRNIKRKKNHTQISQSEKKNIINHELYKEDFKSNKDFEKELEKEMREYIREQERKSMPPPPRTRSGTRSRNTSRSYNPFIRSSNKLNATYSIMAITGLLFLIQLLPNASSFLLLNINSLIPAYMIPIITSMFAPVGLFGLIFAELMLYSLGRTIEKQFGQKFFLTLYFSAGLTSVFIALIIQFIGPFTGLPGFSVSNLISTQWSAILGLMAFMLYIVGLERELRIYFYFIPIRLKGKYILYFLIGYASIFAILGIFFEFAPVEMYIGQLIGIYVGRLFYKKYGTRRVIRSFF